jgi:Protein of unknown function (DUF2829)
MNGLGWAIAYLADVAGTKVQRGAWAPDWWLQLVAPGATTVPYIAIVMGDTILPWSPTQIDLLANDYQFAGPPPV